MDQIVIYLLIVRDYMDMFMKCFGFINFFYVGNTFLVAMH